jgi:pantothenate kinase
MLTSSSSTISELMDCPVTSRIPQKTLCISGGITTVTRGFFVGMARPPAVEKVQMVRKVQNLVKRKEKAARR